jgi:23S rRNA pseudouridine1911/1915/1917 synthase
MPAKPRANVKPEPKPKAKAKPKAAAPAKSKPAAVEPLRLQLLAEPKHKGERLDKALVQLLAERSITRSQLARFFEEGRVHVNGEAAVPRRRLKGGEALTLELPQQRESELKPAKIPLHVLYEDAHLLVVDKPAGLVTHPGAGHQDDTLANALLAHCGASLKLKGQRPGIVHRLDKDTTGCLVAAKTEAAFSALQAMIAGRKVTRLYRALAWGDLREDSGTIDAAMGRGPDRKRMALRPDGGKAAVTHFKVLSRFKHACELECKLETGRTHQIRVHLAGIGHGVVGDPSYGRLPGHLPQSILQGLPKALPRQALHAWRLQFSHPITGKAIRAEAPAPADYLDARRLLQDAE